MDASGAYAEIAGCGLRLRALTGLIGRWFRPSQTRYATALIERTARKAGDTVTEIDPHTYKIIRTFRHRRAAQPHHPVLGRLGAVGQ